MMKRAPCPFCAPPAPLPSPKESDCSDEDWNSDRHREREERKKKEEQQKEEEENNHKGTLVPVDYFPQALFMTQPTKKMPYPIVTEMKKTLDPKYCPSNYVLKEEEDAPTLVDNLVAPPVMATKEDQVEDNKEKINRGETNREEEDRKEGKRQADSGQEAGEEDDYLDYSDSDFYLLGQ